MSKFTRKAKRKKVTKEVKQRGIDFQRAKRRAFGKMATVVSDEVFEEVTKPNG